MTDCYDHCGWEPVDACTQCLARRLYEADSLIRALSFQRCLSHGKYCEGRWEDDRNCCAFDRVAEYVNSAPPALDPRR